MPRYKLTLAVRCWFMLVAGVLTMAMASEVEQVLKAVMVGDAEDTMMLPEVQVVAEEQVMSGMLVAHESLWLVGEVGVVDAAGAVVVEVKEKQVVLRVPVDAGAGREVVELPGHSKEAMAHATMTGEGAAGIMAAVLVLSLEVVVALGMPMVQILYSKLELKMVMVWF